jgi:16S rRNA (guanine527-N7)-methyltransferase
MPTETTSTEASLPMTPLTPRGFRTITHVSRETLGRLEEYETMLTEWRRAIALVGRSSLSDPWRRHFLDSAQLYPLLPRDTRVLLDIGSGAGFPGLVLAILGVPEVHLVESNARKCAFLREVARRTACRAIVHHMRIEELPPFPCEVVTARALAPLPRLLEYAAPFLKKRGILLAPKGRGFKGELTRARKSWTLTAASYPSLSDPSGVILRLKDIARAREPSM